MRRAFAIVGFVFAVVGIAAALGRAPSSDAASCAVGGRAVDARGSVPFGFPLPAALRVTSVVPGAGHTTVVGFVRRKLAVEATFFRDALPGAGFVQTSGDAEFGLEAEARFTSQFAAGRWRVNSIPGCSAWSVVTLEFAARSSARSPA
jgi:hypothetical protein